MGLRSGKKGQIQCRVRFVGETSHVCAAGYCRDGPVCVRVHSSGRIRTLLSVAVELFFGNRFGDDVQSWGPRMYGSDIDGVAKPGVPKPRMLKPDRNFRYFHCRN